jgi:hypothetical protein
MFYGLDSDDKMSTVFQENLFGQEETIGYKFVFYDIRIIITIVDGHRKYGKVVC